MVGGIGYWFTHNLTVALLLFGTTMLFIIIRSVLSIRRSAAYIDGIRILTLIDVPFLTIHYINGHYLWTKKYRSTEWINLSMDRKKECVKQEVKEFARILSSGRYLVETHEAMAHLLLNNLSPNLNVVKSRKFPALSNRKADSEFKLVYGQKDWKEVAGKRKLYIWYFELSKINDGGYNDKIRN